MRQPNLFNQAAQRRSRDNEGEDARMNESTSVQQQSPLYVKFPFCYLSMSISGCWGGAFGVLLMPALYNACPDGIQTNVYINRAQSTRERMESISKDEMEAKECAGKNLFETATEQGLNMLTRLHEIVCQDQRQLREQAMRAPEAECPDLKHLSGLSGEPNLILISDLYLRFDDVSRAVLLQAINMMLMLHYRDGIGGTCNPVKMFGIGESASLATCLSVDNPLVRQFKFAVQMVGAEMREHPTALFFAPRNEASDPVSAAFTLPSDYKQPDSVGCNGYAPW